MLKRMIAFAIIFCFIFEQSGFAQVVTPPQLSLPAYLRAVPPAVDKFRPIQMRSIALNANDATCKILLDTGDSAHVAQQELQKTANDVVSYFQIGMRLPNSVFWVNLRPDAPEDIIDPLLEKTDIGKVFLETDLQLKKDLAKFTDPATARGKEYWDRLYQKVGELFGQDDATIPTVTRPWIVPDFSRKAFTSTRPGRNVICRMARIPRKNIDRTP